MAPRFFLTEIFQRLRYAVLRTRQFQHFVPLGKGDAALFATGVWGVHQRSHLDVDVAQTAASGGLRLCVRNPELPRPDLVLETWHLTPFLRGGIIDDFPTYPNRSLVSLDFRKLGFLAQKIETTQANRDGILRVETALNHLTVIEVPEPITMVAAGSPAFKIERRENKVFIQPLRRRAKHQPIHLDCGSSLQLRTGPGRQHHCHAFCYRSSRAPFGCAR